MATYQWRLPGDREQQAILSVVQTTKADFTCRERLNALHDLSEAATEPTQVWDDQGIALLQALQEALQLRLRAITHGNRPLFHDLLTSSIDQRLAAALADSRARRAVLVIAKLDRLARNVHFVSGLMESGVEFIAADMPTVNRLTVHILAAVAEEEARMISARTKAALTAAKARGVKLGNPHLLAHCPVFAARAREAQRIEARRRKEAVLPYLEQARTSGATTLWQLADALMKRGVPAPRGGHRWHPAQVRRLLGAAQKACCDRRACSRS